MCGRTLASTATASAADPATSTCAPWLLRIADTISRVSASSSTTSTRIPSRSMVRARVSTGPSWATTAETGSWPMMGSRTVKTEPRPSPGLSARTVPPWASTRWRTMARPRPSPPWLRVVELSAWRKASKTWGSRSGAIPMPVSVTRSRAPPLARSTPTSTRPPVSVNFTALLTRFQTTCCMRSGSAATRGTSAAGWKTISIDLASAVGRAPSSAVRTTSARSTLRRSSRMRPVTTRDMSSRSEISAIWARQLRSITVRACRVRSPSRRPACSMRIQPKIELSGVRSSWESVARNSSLTRLASAAWR